MSTTSDTRVRRGSFHIVKDPCQIDELYDNNEERFSLVLATT